MNNIDILEELKEELDEILKEPIGTDEMPNGNLYEYERRYELDLEEIKAVSTLIAENKELKEKYSRKLIDFQKEHEEYEKYYIQKSKVEEEIDKLNKKEKDLQNSISDEEREEYSDGNISFDLMDIDIRRETLQSLLGKE